MADEKSVITISEEKYEHMMSNIGGRDTCWWCGGKLIWQSDFGYDEVFGEGEGIVTYLTCSECGAEVQYSKRTDEPE